MQRKFSMTTFFIILMAITFIILTFIYPKESLEAGVRGISIWWEVLFPALFPFFVLAELMLGLGIVHFAGTVLDPMMRPVFRVTGKGGFVMAMGFASGYPVGARLTSQLWDQKLVTRDEGERLVAFTSTSDPIFLIGAVSVGFFHSPELALVLAGVHYLTGMIVGWLMRFHGKNEIHENSSFGKQQKGIFRRAFQSMHLARINDGRSFWQLLEKAVSSSIMLVFMIGGLVVFFSVFIEVAQASALLPKITSMVGALLSLVGLPAGLSGSLVYGFFEVTLGTKTAAHAEASIDLMHKVAVASVVLAWAGLSVHAQIVSLLNHTNLRYGPFLISRIIHALLAFLFVILLWDPLHAAASSIVDTYTISAWMPSNVSGFSLVPLSVMLFVLLFFIFIVFTAFLFAVTIITKKVRKLF